HLGEARREGPRARAVFAGGGDARLVGRAGAVDREVEPPLPTALQLKIDAGQQLGVDQRAVLLALDQRDLEALTERIQRVVHARIALLRQAQGVDPAALVQRRAAK